MKYYYKTFLTIFAAGFLIGCSNENIDVTGIPGPAENNSQLPYLFTDSEGKIYLSWVEQTGKQLATLKYAQFNLNENNWSTPAVVASGSDWFVNWADYPTVIFDRNGPAAAHWLRKIPGNTYSYEIRMAVSSSRDSVKWTDSFVPHKDGTATEHGFVSMIPWENNTTLAVWLDGRKTAGRGEDEYDDLAKAMTLRAAIINPDGSIAQKYEIDDSVCDCCQTSLAKTANGAIVAYRNRTEDEIRDIYTSRFEHGKWDTPKPVHNDNWKIAACPVNGPRIAARGEYAAVAWFTRAGNKRNVFAAFSSDGGASFSAPIDIDDGTPMGRVDIEMTGDRTAIASWMEKTEEGADIRYREISFPGEVSPSKTISPISAGRGSGFPQISVSGNKVVFAWTEADSVNQVKTAFMKL